jgi:hypothetical protein
MGIRVEERAHQIGAIGKAAISCGTLNLGQHWSVPKIAQREVGNQRHAFCSEDDNGNGKPGLGG